ncbi:hypothetical protein C8R44DRAFT_878729 [Mycena epipterygia]|nr:hypothetical protein C8R44DRAFT_878729 [Mycena epipterygia]
MAFKSDVLPLIVFDLNQWALPEDYRLIYNGRQLCPEDSPATASCLPDATIHLISRLKGGKPVIYLISQLVQQKKSIAGGNTLEWTVRVHPDRSLTERTTGLDVAYLFWEALCVLRLPFPPKFYSPRLSAPTMMPP